MKKFYGTKAFWRAATGFLIGAICDWILLLLVADKLGEYYSNPIIKYAGSLLWFPIVGIISFGSVLPDVPFEMLQNILGVIIKMIGVSMLFLFFPILFATSFSLVGRKQTMKVIVKEIVLAGLYVTLYVIGMFIQS